MNADGVASLDGKTCHKLVADHVDERSNKQRAAIGMPVVVKVTVYSDREGLSHGFASCAVR